MREGRRLRRDYWRFRLGRVKEQWAWRLTGSSRRMRERRERARWYLRFRAERAYEDWAWRFAPAARRLREQTGSVAGIVSLSVLSLAIAGVALTIGFSVGSQEGPVATAAPAGGDYDKPASAAVKAPATRSPDVAKRAHKRRARVHRLRAAERRNRIEARRLRRSAVALAAKRRNAKRVRAMRAAAKEPQGSVVEILPQRPAPKQPAKPQPAPSPAPPRPAPAPKAAPAPKPKGGGVAFDVDG